MSQEFKSWAEEKQGAMDRELSRLKPEYRPQSKEDEPLKYWCHKAEFEQNKASLRHWGLHMRGSYYSVTIKCNNCDHLNEIVLRKGSAAPLNPTCEKCGLPAHTQRIILSENVWTEPKPVK